MSNQPPNQIDFLRASANLMVANRPDFYDFEGAVEELSTAIDELRKDSDPLNGEADFGFMVFASFVLLRFVEDGLEEFVLTERVTGFMFDPAEQAMTAYSFTTEVSELPHILDMIKDD